MPDIPVLTPSNYPEWIEEVEATLRMEGWFSKLTALPPDSTLEVKEYRLHMEGKERAAGFIYRAIAPELRGPVREHRQDAVRMLEILKTTYGRSSFAARNNALSTLVTMSMNTDKSILAFLMRAREALRVIRATRPATGYSL